MGYFEVIESQGASKNIMCVSLNNLLISYKVGLFALAEHTSWMRYSRRNEQNIISN
jgi:hypothetical protein